MDSEVRYSEKYKLKETIIRADTCKRCIIPYVLYKRAVIIQRRYPGVLDITICSLSEHGIHCFLTKVLLIALKHPRREAFEVNIFFPQDRVASFSMFNLST